MDIVALLFDLLAVHGPWLLFVMAVLETCFVTGLVVPSGVATSVSTILALEAGTPLAPFIVAAACGGFVGDSLGYWIGRRSGEHLLREGSRWRRLLGSRWDAVQDLFGRHPFYSVTVARLISFVRTVMPMAAGMSGISYHRYLSFEVFGVLGWTAIYVTIGFGGREGWEAASQIFGVGGAVAFVAAAGVALWVVRRRARAAVEDTG